MAALPFPADVRLAELEAAYGATALAAFPGGHQVFFGEPRQWDVGIGPADEPATT
jgi:hypothetical protein